MSAFFPLPKDVLLARYIPELEGDGPKPLTEYYNRLKSLLLTSDHLILFIHLVLFRRLSLDGKKP